MAPYVACAAERSGVRSSEVTPNANSQVPANVIANVNTNVMCNANVNARKTDGYGYRHYLIRNCSQSMCVMVCYLFDISYGRQLKPSRNYY